MIHDQYKWATFQLQDRADGTIPHRLSNIKITSILTKVATQPNDVPGVDEYQKDIPAQLPRTGGRPCSQHSRRFNTEPTHHQ